MNHRGHIFTLFLLISLVSTLLAVAESKFSATTTESKDIVPTRNLSAKMFGRTVSTINSVAGAQTTSFVQQQLHGHHSCGTKRPKQQHQRKSPYAAHFGHLDTAASCNVNSACDDPVIRDQYSAMTNGTWNLRVEWFVFKNQDSSNFYLNAETYLKDVAATMEQHFAGTGIVLSHSVKKLILKDENGATVTDFFVKTDLQAYDCEGGDPCMDPIDLVKVATAEERSDWHLPGTIQVVVGRFYEESGETTLGYAQFPFEPTRGLLVLADSALRAGYFTASHELGHALGLYHTFTGISELESCGDPCYESKASDTTGDLCSDTDPEPQSFDCPAIPTVAEFPDDCDSSRRSWSNKNLHNIMGYANDLTCNYLFTRQQVGRMRCHLETIIAVFGSTANGLFKTSSIVVALLSSLAAVLLALVL